MINKKSLWIGFIVGNIVALTLSKISTLVWLLFSSSSSTSSLLIPRLELPYQIEKSNYSAQNENLYYPKKESDDDDDEINCDGLDNMKVLLLDVHLEGNLGDEMETLPLLQELKRCKDVHITALLSNWLHTTDKYSINKRMEDKDDDNLINDEEQHQLFSSGSVRLHNYIDVIKLPDETTIQRIITMANEYYDVIILAPGPWRLCQLAKWWLPQHIDIMIGGSIVVNINSKNTHSNFINDNGRSHQETDENAVESENEIVWLDELENGVNNCRVGSRADILQYFDPSLIIVRESLSYKVLQNERQIIIRKQQQQKQKHKQTYRNDNENDDDEEQQQTRIITNNPNHDHNTFELVLSGDLTHSYQLAKSTYEYWKNVYLNICKDKVILFVRSSNINHVMNFSSNVVDDDNDDSSLITLKLYHGNGGYIGNNDENEHNENYVRLSTKEVIFATSSALEDEEYLRQLQKDMYNRKESKQKIYNNNDNNDDGRTSSSSSSHVPKIVICRTVEQLHGLIYHSKHVYTDRYHPGVVAHRLNVPFTILSYPSEQSKLLGLKELAGTKSNRYDQLQERERNNDTVGPTATTNHDIQIDWKVRNQQSFAQLRNEVRKLIKAKQEQKQQGQSQLQQEQEQEQEQEKRLERKKEKRRKKRKDSIEHGI